MESDFFRNRLTHSIEVAQIAKSIARSLNESFQIFKENPIDEDLVSFAGLAHDLGHPPFGHNGEYALDERMKKYGGFEGNAQTLRILSKIEKKRQTGAKEEERFGLDLTYRSLAAVLKYDKKIPSERPKNDSLKKGYYSSESDLVREIKRAVAPGIGRSKFKVVECQIMDVADDIAYSTYDLEDALKAEFVTPLDLISVDDDIAAAIAIKVSENIGSTFTSANVVEVLLDLLTAKDMFDLDSLGISKKDFDLREITSIALVVANSYKAAKEIGRAGTLRTQLTSSLVNEFVQGVGCEPNVDRPMLSRVYLNPDILKRVEVLKHFTFEVLIKSQRVRMTAFRGEEIIGKIFDALAGRNGENLLPPDFREFYRAAANKAQKMRVISDFIAGMTDGYAIEFYGRLVSENPQTIFKPV